jgi:hypothetical protein
VTRDIGSGVYFKIWSGLDTNFTDSGLDSGAYHRYKISAINVIGQGIESAVLTGIAGSLS